MSNIRSRSRQHMGSEMLLPVTASPKPPLFVATFTARGATCPVTRLGVIHRMRSSGRLRKLRVARMRVCSTTA
jgi:hypothetical protein